MLIELNAGGRRSFASCRVAPAGLFGANCTCPVFFDLRAFCHFHVRIDKRLRPSCSFSFCFRGVGFTDLLGDRQRSPEMFSRGRDIAVSRGRHGGQLFVEPR